MCNSSGHFSKITHCETKPDRFSEFTLNIQSISDLIKTNGRVILGYIKWKLDVGVGVSIEWEQ